MRTYLRLVAISAFLVGAAVIVAQPRGPLDPPPGPVQPSGPSLTDIMTSINGLGGAAQGSAVPGDTLYASVPLSLANESIYFQVVGIPGEVTTPAVYAGWTSALSAGQAMTRPPASAAQFSNFRILAQLDKAFPLLMQRGATGVSIPDMTIDFLKTFPSGPVRYLRIRLTTVQVAHVTPIHQSRACLYEFAFTRIEWFYTPLSSTGQPTGADVVFCWNRQSNTQCN